MLKSRIIWGLTHFKVFVEKSARAEFLQNVVLLPRFEVAHRFLVFVASEADLESLSDSRKEDLDESVLKKLLADKDDCQLDDQFDQTSSALTLNNSAQLTNTQYTNS